MSQGLFSIGGIASGLDTSNIVSQLMALERQPVVRLERRQAQLEATNVAWNTLNTRLSSLRTATDQLRRPDRFDDFVSFTSSDSDAVAISRGSGSFSETQLSFTVQQLATYEQRSSSDTFSRDETLGGRTLTIAGTEVTADLSADATLDDLVDAVNEAGLGVRAQALQVTAGEYQLVLDAEESGTAGAVTTSGTGWTDAIAVTQAAQDAHLTVGGIDVFRSSNTIDDLVDGATITLKSTTATEVTVGAARDVDGAVKAVTAFTDAINKAVSTVADLTRYDADTKQAGPLQGQFAASQLSFDLRSAVTAPITGLEGLASLASTIGISVDRDGTVQVDEATLRQAFTDDFEGTAARFARTGSSGDTDVATQVAGEDTTEAGTYAVEVTRAATVAARTGAAYAPPGAAQPKTFMIRSPEGTLVAVEIDTNSTTAAQAAQKINQALEDAGVTDLTASVGVADDGVSDALTLTSSDFGSAQSFEVYEVDDLTNQTEVVGGTVFGLEGTHTGTDVEGTIDGQAATGVGRTLTADTGAAAGLSVVTNEGLDIPTGETRAFDVSFWHGLGGAMDEVLGRAEGTSGTVARARAAVDSQIEIYQSRIDAFELRLESRETTLRRQFVAMEVAMDRFNSQGQWLSGQLAQLGNLSPQRQ